MSPDTEAFVNQATRMMRMGDSSVDIGSATVEADEAAGGSSAKADEISLFLARSSDVMERKKPNILATTSPSTLLRRTVGTALARPSHRTTASEVLSSQPVSAQRLQERKFWELMKRSDITSANLFLSQIPSFIPRLNEECFESLQVIMEESTTQADSLKFLYGKFKRLFHKRFTNGRYISSVTHPDHIRTLLEIFVNDRDLRIALLDDFINSPDSELVLEEGFFNFMINDNNLLKFMFNARPDLFLVDYSRLPEGIYKEKLPILLNLLVTFYQDNDELKLAYFKISAVNPGVPFDFRILENIQDNLRVQIFEFLATIPADQVSQSALQAVAAYNIPQTIEEIDEDYGDEMDSSFLECFTTGEFSSYVDSVSYPIKRPIVIRRTEPRQRIFAAAVDETGSDSAIFEEGPLEIKEAPLDIITDLPQVAESVPPLAVQKVIVTATNPLEKLIWEKINTGKSVTRLLDDNPDFVPSMGEYTFRKMTAIMSNPRTTENLLSFISGRFGLFFKTKFENDQWIYHVSHPENVLRIARLNPGSLRVKIAILDEYLSHPQLHTGFDREIFELLFNDVRLLLAMFDARPDLLCFDYGRLPEGDIKVCWKDMLTKLLISNPKKFKMVYLKMAIWLKDGLGNADDSKIFLPLVYALSFEEILEIINYIRIIPIGQANQKFLTAIYGETSGKLRNFLFPNGESILTQAIKDGRTDIVDVIMSLEQSCVLQYLRLRNGERKSPFRVAVDVDAAGVHPNLLTLQYVATEGKFVILKKLMSRITKCCESGNTRSLSEWIPLYYQNAYGDSTVLNALRLELIKNKSRIPKSESEIREVLNNLGLAYNF